MDSSGHIGSIGDLVKKQEADSYHICCVLCYYVIVCIMCGGVLTIKPWALQK